MIELLLGILILLVVILIFLHLRSNKTGISNEALQQILSVADSKFSDTLKMGSSELDTKKELIGKELSDISGQVKAVSDILAQVKAEYKDISQNALKQNTDYFTQTSQEKLNRFSETGQLMIRTEAEKIDKSLETNQKLFEEKRNAISERISQMETIMQTLTQRIGDYEQFNTTKFEQLSEQIQHANNLTLTLSNTTNNLINMLKNTKARGQFGEQIAEDILRFAGFIENINYYKQTSEVESGRPDFQFLLPESRSVYMDVKFPLNNYQMMFQSETDDQKSTYEKQFLKDVKTHIKGLTKRDYVSEKSLDYIIMFIPNEAIFSFINESDPHMVLDALKDKIIVCSPLTLFAVLAIIKQSLNNFKLHETASEMQSLMRTFYDEWQKYSEEIEKLKKQMGTVSTTFDRLTTTRKNKLEKSLDKIKSLDIDQNQLN